MLILKGLLENILLHKTTLLIHNDPESWDDFDFLMNHNAFYDGIIHQELKIVRRTINVIIFLL